MDNAPAAPELLRNSFLEFLSPDIQGGRYFQKVGKLLEKHKTRLIVDMRDLEQYDRNLYNGILHNPLVYIPPFEDALTSIVTIRYPQELSSMSSFGKVSPRFTVGFTGSFGPNSTTPRSVKASHIHKLICLEGVVIRASPVIPLPRQMKHYCPATEAWHVRTYQNPLFSGPMTSFSGKIATRDENQNLLTQEYGLSEFIDAQLVTIQEAPEQLPHGQLPRSVECLLLSDLADVASVGSRVLVAGVLRLTHGGTSAPSNASFPSTLIAVSMQVLNEDSKRPRYSAEDLRKLKVISKQPNLFDLLSSSVAPSIFGHSAVKKGILLMLSGGVEQLLGPNTKIRGDVHLLLVGDPATAKSQLLRYTLRTVTIGVSASGRGATSAGLTAAVVSDPFSSSQLSTLGVGFEKRLEAGALVLADRGVCIIDEFDKLDDVDRGVLHEVMEQQTVSIAKGGIQATLNARCSILAAANPLHNSFDADKNLAGNIGIPESLLSRFDLVFVVRGGGDVDSDSKIASHVLKIHSEATKLTGNDAPAVFSLLEMPQFEDDSLVELDNLDVLATQVDSELQPIIFDLNDILLEDKTLPQDILRKYLYYSKTRFTPKLTNEAAQSAIDFYCELREKASNEAEEGTNGFTGVVTARSLETVFRLAAAHAKLRWSNLIEVNDVEAAIEVINAALNSPLTNFYSESNLTTNNHSNSSRNQARMRTNGPDDDVIPKRAHVDDSIDQILGDYRSNTPVADNSQQDLVVSESRYEEFKTLMFNCLAVRKARTRHMTLKSQDFISFVNNDAPSEFTSAEVGAILVRLQEEEIVIVSDGAIVFI
ncbi:hypothetical protein RCL1_002208 [Eukaryota sp. TZLM3-RCL]